MLVVRVGWTQRTVWTPVMVLVHIAADDSDYTAKTESNGQITTIILPIY